MVIELRPLGDDRFEAWRDGTKQRLIVRSRESGMRVGDDAIDFAEAFLHDLLPQGAATPNAGLFVMHESDEELGTIWLAETGGKLFLVDLGPVSSLSGAQRDALFDTILGIADDRDLQRISVALFPQDVEGHALITGRGFVTASIQMVLEPLPDREVATHVDVAPMTEARFPSFLEHSEAAFADDLVASGRYDAAGAAVESRRQMRLELPQGLETPGQKFFTASVDGVEVGILWIGIRRRNGRPHVFILDIEVAEDQRRRGYGRELMHAAEREARLLGADSIGLHVFGFNTGAAQLYESLGYRRVEETFLLQL